MALPTIVPQTEDRTIVNCAADPEEETGPQEEGGPGGYPPPDDRTPSVAGLTIHDLADVAWLCERHDYTLEDALAAVVAFNAATEPEPPTPPAAPAARPVTREAACKHCHCPYSKEAWNGWPYDDPTSPSGHLCFTCHFWLEDVRATAERNIVFAGHCYTIGDEPRPGQSPRQLGFGGACWHIVYTDGRTVSTRNLWYRGEVPGYLRTLFPDNVQSLKEVHR